MSYVPGDKSENPEVHFRPMGISNDQRSKAGMKDLLRFDKVRLIRPMRFAFISNRHLAGLCPAICRPIMLIGLPAGGKRTF